MPQLTQNVERCIKLCAACAEACLQTMRHCLEKGGKHAEARHIGLLVDCADICETSANFMLRGSELHGHTCRACAEVCRACAESCAGMPADEQMTRCVEACRECEASCREMAS